MAKLKHGVGIISKLVSKLGGRAKVLRKLAKQGFKTGPISALALAKTPLGNMMPNQMMAQDMQKQQMDAQMQGQAVDSVTPFPNSVTADLAAAQTASPLTSIADPEMAAAAEAERKRKLYAAQAKTILG